MVTLRSTYKFCLFTLFLYQQDFQKDFSKTQINSTLPREFSRWAIREQNFCLSWFLWVTLPNSVCSEVVVSLVTPPPPTLTLPVLSSATHAERLGGWADETKPDRVEFSMSAAIISLHCTTSLSDSELLHLPDNGFCSGSIRYRANKI